MWAGIKDEGKLVAGSTSVPIFPEQNQSWKVTVKFYLRRRVSLFNIMHLSRLLQEQSYWGFSVLNRQNSKNTNYSGLKTK